MRNIFLLFVLFAILKISAQTSVCKIDTTGWERISTITLDVSEQIYPTCRIDYNSHSGIDVGFSSSFKDQKFYFGSKLKAPLDLSAYNLIKISSRLGICDVKMKYSFSKDKSGKVILIVNLFIPESKKIQFTSIGSSFLVLKKDCPDMPVVYVFDNNIVPGCYK